MPVCPNCAKSLNTVRYREGLFYLCPTCDSRAVTIPQIRRVAGDRFATELLRQINSNSVFCQRPCPFCRRDMRQFKSVSPPLELDACKPCGVVWFDPAEFTTVPELPLPKPEHMEATSREAIALYQVEQIAERARRSDPTPDASWKTVPALFGFPVEADTNPLARLPVATWSLAAVVAIVSIWSFSNLDDAVRRFGFVPAEFWRMGGLTAVTSFFLHAGWMHLIGNLYFLLIFGDDVENHLGRPRFLGLILVATMGGDLLHFFLQPQSAVPCIGASGGISGIIAFYALQFPRARLGFLFLSYAYRFHWLQLPAWGALVLWVLLQIWISIQQQLGVGTVSGAAHLGGAVVGFLAWLWWRKKLKGDAPPN